MGAGSLLQGSQSACQGLPGHSIVGRPSATPCGEAPALLVVVRCWLSRGSWRASGLIRCQHAGARTVRLSSKSADLKRHCLGTCLGRCLGLVLSLICHVGAAPTAASGVPLQAPVLGRWFWKTAVAKHRGGAVARTLTPSGHETSRISRTFLLAVALLALRVVGSSRSPGPAHCHVACAAWLSHTTLRGFCSTSHRQSLPTLLHKLLSYQLVLMALPWLLAAEGLDDRRWLLPLIRQHSARPSRNSNLRGTCAQGANVG